MTISDVKRTSALLALLAPAMTGVATGAAATPSPPALVHALVTAPIPASQVPAALRPAKISAIPLTEQSIRYHGVGTIEVGFDDSDDVVIYVVFPSRPDALADFAHPHQVGRVTDKLAGPPSLPKPSEILDGSISGKNAAGKPVTNGVTGVAFVVRNVIVEAATLSTTSTTVGDLPGTIRLAALALRHLTAVEKAGG